MTYEDQGYHPANLDLQPYPHEAVIELAKHAVRLGVQFKINGVPYGAAYDKKLWNAFNENEGPAADRPAYQLSELLQGATPENIHGEIDW